MMATYEYKCPQDGQVLTVRRPMAEDPPEYYCELCNSVMQQVYYATPVKFNAPGFYSTGG